VTAVLLAFGMILPMTASAQGARQGLLSLDGARIFYEVVGTGDPVVVVHGGPGLDHNYLRPGLDALGSRNTLIYYDQRGTGRSTAELVDSVINIDRFVDDIDALRQGLGYERISVLGHSFGALIAIEYARRYPEQLRSLILMNPVEPGQRFGAETAVRQQNLRTAEDTEDMSALRATEAFAARDAATLSEFYRVAFRPLFKDRAKLADLEMDLMGTTARYGQDVAALLGGSLGTVDWWERLGSIDVPVLVLHGRFDAPPAAMSRGLAEAFSHGTFVELDSGHFPYLEDRQGLVSAVSAFFASLR
jgi:proline iminopeptidase